MKKYSFLVAFLLFLSVVVPAYAQDSTPTTGNTPPCPSSTPRAMITATGTPGIDMILDDDYILQCSHCLNAAVTPTPCYCATMESMYATQDALIPTLAVTGTPNSGGGRRPDCPCLNTPAETPTPLPTVPVGNRYYIMRHSINVTNSITGTQYLPNLFLGQASCYGDDEMEGVWLYADAVGTFGKLDEGSITISITKEWGGWEPGIALLVPDGISYNRGPEYGMTMAVKGEGEANIARCAQLKNLLADPDIMSETCQRDWHDSDGAIYSSGVFYGDTATYHLTEFGILCYGDNAPVPTPTIVPEQECSEPSYHVVEPLMEFTGLELIGTTCYTVIPELELKNPLNDEVLFAINGWGVCVDWYTTPSISLWGINLPVTAILIIPLAWLLISLLRL